MTSDECQVGGERVEPQPTQRRQHNSIVARPSEPTRNRPTRETRAISGPLTVRPAQGSQRQIHLLGHPVVRRSAPRSPRSGPRRSQAGASTRRTPATFQRRTRPSNSCADGPRPAYGAPDQYAELCRECRPGAAEVRDLVVLEARGRERVVRVQELEFVPLVGRLGELAARLPSAHRRVRLDRQPVQRQVRRLELERARDVASPTIARRPPAARRSGRARGSRCRRAAPRRPRARIAARVVRAMHPREHAIVERLAAERQPIDARVDPRRDRVGVDVFRIRLERDFGVRRRGRFADAASTASTRRPRRPRRDGVPPPKYSVSTRPRLVVAEAKLQLALRAHATYSSCGTTRRTAIEKSQYAHRRAQNGT